MSDDDFDDLDDKELLEAAAQFQVCSYPNLLINALDRARKLIICLNLMKLLPCQVSC